MAKVRIYKSAEKDMCYIYKFIAADNVEQAINMLNKFEDAFKRLECFPESGNTVNIHRKDYRKLVVDNYLLFYIIVGDEVQIRRVIYGTMLYENLI
jgi:addiction module RelE/StbE family toxin